MRRVKKACVSSSAMPSRWSTQPSRVTLMPKVRRPMAQSSIADDSAMRPKRSKQGLEVLLLVIEVDRLDAQGSGCNQVLPAVIDEDALIGLDAQLPQDALEDPRIVLARTDFRRYRDRVEYGR